MKIWLYLDDDLHEALVKRAEEDLRPLDMEIIYLLKRTAGEVPQREEPEEVSVCENQ